MSNYLQWLCFAAATSGAAPDAEKKIASNMHWVDIAIVVFYLCVIVSIGFIIKRIATSKLDNYYLAGRNMPWWLLGMAGCSSYMDMTGTMAMIGALYYLGLKSIWMTHIFWGWLIIAGYMAFQAKWIRRSGVMTFAEWNETRYGKNKDAEMARLAAATFLLLLMVFNLTFIAVGIGKFAEQFLPLQQFYFLSPQQQASILVFAVIGAYVTLGGFMGVIITDIMQTTLIGIGAVILTFYIFSNHIAVDLSTQAPGWSSMALSWSLWDNLTTLAPDAYHKYTLFGPMLLCGFTWLIFRVLAGPNVWDFQFFLTARSPRDAALAGAMWTVGYNLRWIIAIAFMVLGLVWLKHEPGFDAEKVMPMVINKIPVGVKGYFIAILLAALISMLNAMVNVTSSVVLNDFLKRYLLKNLPEKTLVRYGQLASGGVLVVALAASFCFSNILSAWETMIFVVVTMILVPATMRWHWWRFSARAFVFGMIATAAFIIVQKIFLAILMVRNDFSPSTLNLIPMIELAVNVIVSFVLCLIIGFICKPPEMDILVKFYAHVNPFGFWKPVREVAIERGLVKRGDKTPYLDALNLILVCAFQMLLAMIPFYAFLRDWTGCYMSVCLTLVLMFILYFTWYKILPARDEK
jgi:SSS family solute:Na+ symporter